jgi:hypothetical protein
MKLQVLGIDLGKTVFRSFIWLDWIQLAGW